MGDDAVWLAEIHFQKDRSVLASPLVIAAALAACTRRVKIGIAVQVLPLSHPLRLAEDVATVDHLARFQDVYITPKPYQKPHPPIRIAATTPETYPLVGQLGARSSWPSARCRFRISSATCRHTRRRGPPRGTPGAATSA